MFSNTPVYNVGGDIVFGLMRDPVIPDSSDSVYTVPALGEVRLDLISEAFYGTPGLWWIIASVNNIFDPLTGITPGTQIRIPTKDRLAREGALNN